MTAGSVTVAMTRTSPPHWGQRLRSMAHTRWRRAIQLIGAVRALGACSLPGGPVGALGRATMRWRWRAPRRKQAVIAHQMGPGPRHQGGQARDEVLGFEQDVGGAITERPFELEHHQPVAVDVQALLGDRRSGHVAA